jgi:CRISPR-associated endonuclease/helicase Cas3
LEGRILGNQYTQFFIDTWRSEVVLTTFDQLLLALFSSKTRHLMRFHRLMDALIILDEVQTLPCVLWNLVDHALRALTEEGNSRVLMMSATQPALLSNAQELAGGEEEVAEIFSRFRRYRIHFHQQQTRLLEDFISELYPRLDKWMAAGKRVLITLNTRASARKVWRAVSEHLGCVASVYLISADITPRDRLIKISAVKEGKPCIVVSTQTVEAGVDIDMDVTLRDFAPLDALIQVAGRCNRNNGLGDHGGQVEIVSLMSEKNRNYAHMVYDSVLLDASHTVLEELKSIGEEGILDLSQRYFTLLKERVDTGKSITEAFAYWREMPNIHSLLRGKEREQVSFLVLDDEKGAELHAAIKRALANADRWERREEFQRLAGAIQKRTVSIYAGRNLHPEDYANPLGPLWVLNEGWYSTDSGLDLQLEEDDPACII